MGHARPMAKDTITKDRDPHVIPVVLRYRSVDPDDPSLHHTVLMVDDGS